MPSPERIAQAKLRVTVTAATALLIAGILVYLLSGNAFQRKVRLRVFVPDATGLGGGSNVRLNGVPVGDVEFVQLTGSTDPARAVDVEIDVQTSMLPQIPEDSTAMVTADNVLGDKLIEIEKGKSNRPIKPNGELRYLATPTVSNPAELLASLRQRASDLDETLRKIQAGEGNLGQFVRGEEVYNDFVAKVEQTRRAIAKTVDRNTPTGHLIYDDTQYQRLLAAIRRVNDYFAGFENGGGPASRFLHDSSGYDELQRQLADVRRTLEDLNAGKGSGGEFLKNGQLYRELEARVAALDRSLTRFSTGEGTLGRMFSSSETYDSLSGATRELRSIVTELRANPQKFLRVKLF